MSDLHPIYYESPYSKILRESTLLKSVRFSAGNVVIVTDESVAELYGHELYAYFAIKTIPTKIILIPDGEQSKSRSCKQYIEDKMLEQHCGRDTVMIALGGGVVTDLAGFVAATYCRGIPVIYIPTTVIGMVDASIGGKTGINTPSGKNLLGTFTLPKAVFIDPKYLETLPEREYLSGFSEVIKHALIYDTDYFCFIESNIDAIKERDQSILKKIIRRSCEIKMEIVSADAKETGQRVILNFGHTIGHALEKLSDYRLSHGEAVAIGMVAESFLSMKLKRLSSENLNRIMVCLRALGINYYVPIQFSKDDLLSAMARDKKNRQQENHFVILENIGKISDPVDFQYTSSVSEKSIEQVYEFLTTFLKAEA